MRCTRARGGRHEELLKWTGKLKRKSSASSKYNINCSFNQLVIIITSQCERWVLSHAKNPLLLISFTKTHTHRWIRPYSAYKRRNDSFDSESMSLWIRLSFDALLLSLSFSYCESLSPSLSYFHLVSAWKRETSHAKAFENAQTLTSYFINKTHESKNHRHSFIIYNEH